MRYRDRRHAGEALARVLASDPTLRHDILDLGLPRGGVPVAAEVARALAAPLDVFVVRKLGVPGHEELAMGAIAAGGVRVLNEDVVGALGIPGSVIERVTAVEQRELARRETRYHRAPPDLRGRTVVLVDDGLATGSTMRAAAIAARTLGAARTIVAVPVGAADTCAALREVADEVVCLFRPTPLYAVGAWYDDFTQVTDDEVRDFLAEDRAAPLTLPEGP